MHAAANGSFDIVKLLISRQANVNKVNQVRHILCSNTDPTHLTTSLSLIDRENCIDPRSPESTYRDRGISCQSEC